MTKESTTPEVGQDKLTPQEAWKQVVELRPELKPREGDKDFRIAELKGLLAYKLALPDDTVFLANTLRSVERVIDFWGDGVPATAVDHVKTIRFLAHLDDRLADCYQEGSLFRDVYRERGEKLIDIASRIEAG